MKKARYFFILLTMLILFGASLFCGRLSERICFKVHKPVILTNQKVRIDGITTQLRTLAIKEDYESMSAYLDEIDKNFDRLLQDDDLSFFLDFSHKWNCRIKSCFKNELTQEQKKIDDEALP